MGRRRGNERPPDVPVDASGTVVVEPDANGRAAEPVPPSPAEPKNGPVAGFAAHSDRATRLEVAVWARLVKAGEGEEVTQYSLTLNRALRDQDGKWTDAGAYRAHDVPVLLYLVQRAHDWCVAQRTQVRTGPGEELPF